METQRLDLLSNINLLVITNQAEIAVVGDKSALYDGTLNNFDQNLYL